MNLKENKEEYMKVFEGKKVKNNYNHKNHFNNKSEKTKI